MQKASGFLLIEGVFALFFVSVLKGCIFLVAWDIKD